MKIHKLVLQNIKSFRDETVVEFRKGINVLIGPNNAGKSNLMDIINICLSHYFIYPWRLVSSTLPSGLERHHFQQKRDLFHPIQQFLEKNLEIEDQDQKITICFEVMKEDLKNLEIIKNHKEKLAEFENQEYGSNHLNKIEISDDGFQKRENIYVEYQIHNLAEPKINMEDAFSKVFLKYLNYHEMISILIENYNKKASIEAENIKQLFPLALYFSPYRNPVIKNLLASIAGQNGFDIKERYKKNISKDISSILEYANFYFASKLRNYDDNKEQFNKDEEVKFVQNYIKKLGYEDFGVIPINKQKNIYKITLTKDHVDIDITKASSGEKEILNLLLGIFAFNIKGGIVIIDEPDLHLHPRWQRLLLELFYGLSKKAKIQFFIATHSPRFITTDSIKDTIRVFKEKNTSRAFVPKNKEIEKSDIKDIFQIVNILNNEKIFFADKVILVEGVVDRIIYESILKNLQKIKRNSEVIEVVEVYGKENFEKFNQFLKTWKIRSYIFADFDYLDIKGSDDIKKLFGESYDKMKKALDNPTSKDAKSLLISLNKIIAKKKEEISEEDLQDLGELFNYIKKRHVSLKEDIKGKDKKKVESYIESLYQKNIFILKNGEIEDYFGGGHFDIKRAINITIDLNKNKIPEEIRTNFIAVLNR